MIVVELSFLLEKEIMRMIGSMSGWGREKKDFVERFSGEEEQSNERYSQKMRVMKTVSFE